MFFIFAKISNIKEKIFINIYELFWIVNLSFFLNIEKMTKKIPIQFSCLTPLD